MNKDRFISIIFGLLCLVAFLYPDLDIQTRWITAIVGMLSIVFIFVKDYISLYTRKYWQEIVCVALFIIGYLFFRNIYPQLVNPAILIVIISSGISILISTKYRGNLVYQTKKVLLNVSIDSSWQLNHWGNSFARLMGNEIVFSGDNPQQNDGCNKDLLGVLQLGGTYEVSCLVKSSPGTTAKFQLWCHDKNDNPNGISVNTQFFTPSHRGQRVSVIFKATFNKSIRIHLQYSPGAGSIIASKIEIKELI